MYGSKRMHHQRIPNCPNTKPQSGLNLQEKRIKYSTHNEKSRNTRMWSIRSREWNGSVTGLPNGQLCIFLQKTKYFIFFQYAFLYIWQPCAHMYLCIARRKKQSTPSKELPGNDTPPTPLSYPFADIAVGAMHFQDFPHASRKR
jgi:hypothetical protein